ncbi:hypothetical protein Tco_0617011, partial [Tanacetum coccineum]
AFFSSSVSSANKLRSSSSSSCAADRLRLANGLDLVVCVDACGLLDQRDEVEIEDIKRGPYSKKTPNMPYPASPDTAY